MAPTSSRGGLVQTALSFGPGTNQDRTVEYDPSIKSQLASRNSLQGLVWCKSGQVTVEMTRPWALSAGHRVCATTDHSDNSSKLRAVKFGAILDVRTTISQKCEAVPGRARI